MALHGLHLCVPRISSAAVPAWKTAESPLLRHRLAVLRRQQPRCPNLDWADRVLLATLLRVIPGARRRGPQPVAREVVIGTPARRAMVASPMLPGAPATAAPPRPARGSYSGPCPLRDGPHPAGCDLAQDYQA
jgi:hypothetical protein